MQVQLFLISAPDGGEWLVSHTGRYPPTKGPLHPLSRIRLRAHNPHPSRNDLEILEEKNISCPPYRAVHKITCPLCDPEIQHRCHNSPPVVPVVIKINSAHILRGCFLLRHILILSPSTYILSSDLVPSGFGTKTAYTFCIFACALYASPTSFLI